MSYPLFDGFCLMGRYGLDNAEDTCSVSCHLLMFFAIIADQRNQGTNCTPVGLKTFIPAFHSSTIEKYHFSSLSSHTVRIFLSSNNLDISRFVILSQFNCRLFSSKSNDTAKIRILFFFSKLFDGFLNRKGIFAS